MSLRNDIEMVREELNSEEKFFEKAVMTERFVKKYKNVLLGSLALVVVVIGANIAYDFNKKGQTEAANEAFRELTLDATNVQALSRLQTLSPNLHDVWLYSKAIADKDMPALEKLKNSKAALVADLAAYESAKELKQFESYASGQNALYKDLAQVQSAVLLMNEGKMEAAHQKLSQVGEQSSLYKVAKSLLHYGVK